MRYNCPAQCWMFLLGCFCYSFLEILARGYTHWTMLLTGGLVSVLLYRLSLGAPPHTMLLQCLCGALLITAVEFIVGVITNLWLGWNVWDYSDMPYNLYGQICLPFTGLWFLLCFPALWVCQGVQKRFQPEAHPHFPTE